MKLETLQELVKARKGYKHLSKDRTSPYQDYKYVFRKGKIFNGKLNRNANTECGIGWHLATLDWILNDTNIFNKIIVEFSIPEKAEIIVPYKSEGKFRTNIIKYEKIWNPEDLFPVMKDLNKRLKKYKPINFISATKMPDKKKILDAYRKNKHQLNTKAVDTIIYQIVHKIKYQSENQVNHKILTHIKNQVIYKFWDQIDDMIWYQFRNQFSKHSWYQVRHQFLTQIDIMNNYAIKIFMKLDYENHIFDIIHLGIIIIKLENKLEIFGKNGKYLGGIDD